MSKEGRNEALIVKLIEEIREGGEELMSELTEDERTDLERIQYETYIKTNIFYLTINFHKKFWRNNE